jgi:hypothetical protein
MSVKIQPQQNVLPETGPKETVPLSERVLARLPPRQPPEPEENPTAPLPEATQPAEHVLTDAGAQFAAFVSPPAGQNRSGELAAGDLMSLAVLRRAAGDPARAAALAEARKAMAHATSAGRVATPSINAGIAPVPTTADGAAAAATAAAAAAATAAASASADASSAAAKVAVARGNADSLPASLPTGAGSDAATSPQPPPSALSLSQAQARSAAAANGLPVTDDGALPPSVPQTTAAERASAADSTAALTPVAQTTAPLPGGETRQEGQSLADADRAADNRETQRHVRAAREADALQTRMETRASGSQVQVGFTRWGTSHSVNVQMDGELVRMKPSTEQVRTALESERAPSGTRLRIGAVDSSESATDKRHGRRNGQGHA